jgi:hypothetical protein
MNTKYSENESGLTGEVLVNRGEGVELVLEEVLVLVVKETIELHHRI